MSRYNKLSLALVLLGAVCSASHASEQRDGDKKSEASERELRFVLVGMPGVFASEQRDDDQKREIFDDEQKRAVAKGSAIGLADPEVRVHKLVPGRRRPRRILRIPWDSEERENISEYRRLALLGNNPELVKLEARFRGIAEKFVLVGGRRLARKVKKALRGYDDYVCLYNKSCRQSVDSARCASVRAAGDTAVVCDDKVHIYHAGEQAKVTVPWTGWPMKRPFDFAQIYALRVRKDAEGPERIECLCREHSDVDGGKRMALWSIYPARNYALERIVIDDTPIHRFIPLGFCAGRSIDVWNARDNSWCMLDTGTRNLSHGFSVAGVKDMYVASCSMEPHSTLVLIRDNGKRLTLLNPRNHPLERLKDFLLPQQIYNGELEGVSFKQNESGVLLVHGNCATTYVASEEDVSMLGGSMTRALQESEY